MVSRSIELGPSGRQAHAGQHVSTGSLHPEIRDELRESRWRVALVDTNKWVASRSWAADAVRAMWEKHMIEIECDTFSRVASRPGRAVFLFLHGPLVGAGLALIQLGLEHLVPPT